MKISFLISFIICFTFLMCPRVGHAKEPGCNKEVAEFQQSYTEVQRIKERSATRAGMWRNDSNVGLGCMSQSLGYKSSMGIDFSDVMSKFTMPPNWFNFTYNLNVASLNLRSLVCDGIPPLLSGDAKIALNLPCGEKTTLSGSIDDNVTKPMNDHMKQMEDDGRPSGFSNAGPAMDWLGAAKTSSGSAGELFANCMDLSAMVDMAGQLMGKLGGFPYMDPAALLAILSMLKALTLKDVICNGEEIMADLKALMKELTKIKCASIEGSFGGGASGGSKLTGGGIDSKGMPYTSGEDFAKSAASGKAGVTTKEANTPEAKAAIKKASDDIDKLFSPAEAQIASWPESPTIELPENYKKGTARTEDLIRCLDQDISPCECDSECQARHAADEAAAENF